MIPIAVVASQRQLYIYRYAATDSSYGRGDQKYGSCMSMQTSYGFPVQEGNTTCIPPVVWTPTTEEQLEDCMLMINNAVVACKAKETGSSLVYCSSMVCSYLCSLNVHVYKCTPINPDESSINPDTIQFLHVYCIHMAKLTGL